MESPHRRAKMAPRALMTFGIPCTEDASPPVDHACMVRAASADYPGSSLAKWLLDSGASHHYTCDRSLFTSYRELSPPTQVETASGHVSATGIGSITLRLFGGSVVIPNVMWVPSLNKNTYLLSLGQLEANGLQFRFQQGGCYIFQPDGTLWAIASRRNFVYYLHELSDDSITHYP